MLYMYIYILLQFIPDLHHFFFNLTFIFKKKKSDSRYRVYNTHRPPIYNIFYYIRVNTDSFWFVLQGFNQSTFQWLVQPSCKMYTAPRRIYYIIHVILTHKSITPSVISTFYEITHSFIYTKYIVQLFEPFVMVSNYCSASLYSKRCLLASK